MDELNFRRGLYTEPNNQDPDFLKALKDPKNKDLADDVFAFDSKLKKAMEVDVPADLANKLLLKQAISSHQHHQKKSRVHIALAASVAFAVGISYSLFSSVLPTASVAQSLTAHAMEHVIHEEQYFSNSSDARVSLASLNTKMADLNGQFSAPIGELMAAGYCIFDGVKSLHLVYKGEHDSIAVFLLPKSSQYEFLDEEIKGSLKALATQYQNQQVIIVGNAKEKLQPWQRKIDNTLQWSI